MRFTKDHEWVSLEGTVATIGITDHAQQALGDVVFVELPEPGRAVTQGESVAVVESVKAASDIYAPLTGTVTENNASLADDPSRVNAEAESGAWFFRMEIPSVADYEALMDKAAYDEFVGSL